MFGTDDVIYVPEGAQLLFDDVYRWRRFRLDVRTFGLRLAAAGLEHTRERMERALVRVKESPRFADSALQIAVNTGIMLEDLAAASAPDTGGESGSLSGFFRTGDVRWWVRLTDLPAESFFDEDYERPAVAAPGALAYRTYGTVHIAQLDGLDLHLVRDGNGAEPLCIDVPEPGGLGRFTLPPDQPLALVREYCGVHGASAYGHTLNVNTHAAIPEDHQFCTPLGRVGGKLFATLYVLYRHPVESEVLGQIPEDALPAAIELLETSGFALLSQGRRFRIYAREGDVVHLYAGLDGKESEGVREMPAFLLVAQAGGQFDPMNRGALFEGIRDTLRAARRGGGGAV